MKSKETIELSPKASKELVASKQQLDYLVWPTTFVSTVVTGISLMLHFVPRYDGWTLPIKTWVIMNLINLGFWASLWAIFGPRTVKKYFTEKPGILEENLMDYNRSVELGRRFENIRQLKTTDFPAAEDYIGTSWKPIRVEHMLSLSLRNSINSTGVVTPMLAESSSMIILKDNSGDTLRVLVPAPTVIREFLVKAIENSSVVEEKTHTHEVFKTFSVDNDNFIRPLASPKMIDHITTICDLPENQRANVKVKGIPIQEGVVIASQIETEDGRQQLFFPSGYFNAVMEELTPVLTPKELNPASMVSIDATPVKALPGGVSVVGQVNHFDTPQEFTLEDQWKKSLFASV